MATIRTHIDTTGILNSAVNARMRELTAKAIAVAIVDEVEAIEGEAKKKILREPKTGREYRIPGRRNVTYQASSPGQAPANRTGNLASNIIADRKARREARALISAGVVSRADYSEALERGTSRMEARPFMEPSSDKNRLGLSKDRAKRVMQRVFELLKQNGRRDT